ncbi:MAG: AraC family transcriptional regulator [Rhodoferax sp.]
MSSSPSITSAPPLTVSVVFVRGMLSGLLAKGIDCNGWLRSVGIAPELLTHDAARINLHQVASLLHLLIEARDDECLGLYTRRSKRGSFALQVRSAIGAKTLETALRHVAHIFHLLHDDVSLLPVREASGLAGVEFEFHDPQVARNHFVHESLLRTYWRLFAWLVGGQLPPVRFDFAFERPPYSEGYGRIFPAPWRFDAPRSAVWFEAQNLQLPVCRDEPAYRVFVKDGPINVILPSRDLGVSGRVRIFLKQTQPEWPDLERTAKAMNMSASTLQRHLMTEGTSFQAMKNLMRRDVAIFRLHTSSEPLSKLAEEVGFSDTAAFQKAFKVWTGHPPGIYRRKREA